MRILSLLIFILFISFDNLLAEEILLSGDLTISEPLIYKNQKVRIMPNTKIRIHKDLDSGLIFENSRLIIEGTASEPVVIEGYGDNADIEDKNFIHLENSDFSINNAVFQKGGWYLHIHHSKGEIKNSFFFDSYGSIRFTGDNIKIRRNIFKGNTIAVRFINANPVVQDNIFLKNRIAIFLREGVNNPLIKNNTFLYNEFDLYGGFFQDKDIEIISNFFYREPSFFDNKKDDSLRFNIIAIDNLTTFPDWH